MTRKIIFFNLISANGFFEGVDNDISWHNVDEEFNDFALEQLQSLDGLLFGRKTYELMASYWPTEEAIKDDPFIAGKMNSLPKLVFSNTLQEAGWSQSRLVRGDIVAEIKKLKQQPGKDLAIFGSSDLSVTLAQAGLIDEFRIMVNPVLLGQGKPLLQGLPAPLTLKLIQTRSFRNGNVLLYYKPQQG